MEKPCDSADSSGGSRAGRNARKRNARSFNEALLDRLVEMETKLIQHTTFMEAQLSYIAQLMSPAFAPSFFAHQVHAGDTSSQGHFEIPRYKFHFQDVDLEGGAWAAPSGVQPEPCGSSFDTQGNNAQGNKDMCGSDTHCEARDFSDKQVQWEPLDDFFVNAGTQWELLLTGAVTDSAAQTDESALLQCETEDVGIQYPEKCDQILASLQGTWWNGEQQVILVDGSNCSFNEGDPSNLEVENGSVSVLQWVLLAVSDDGLLAEWSKDSDTLFWFRSESAAVLNGDWHNSLGVKVHVHGNKCFFGEEDEDPSTLDFDTLNVTINGWSLLNIADDKHTVYWKRDSEIIHWSRVHPSCDSTDSLESSPLPLDGQAVCDMEKPMAATSASGMLTKNQRKRRNAQNQKSGKSESAP